ncbi:extracellular solute-binding protein [Paenibacillus contaminans]|uniref:ABC transporter substrate-binding protein n=1 Tax=Paenibacillus contaminans TaxID=450362 RepID=A0A329MQ56_9BACL|nr:extracellular solute-binding protein [Paenibacillus contaminans]RAV21660.1 ABC transporter substrate-binding protein [Paenibacillus contaminans]
MRKGLIVLMTGCFSLTAVACSGGGNSSSSPAASAGPKDSPAATAASKKPYEISFMNFAYTIFPPAQGKALDAIKEKFNADVKSQFVLAADYNNKLSVVMASGNMPDVVSIMNADSNYYKWAKQGAFLPLNDYIDKYESLKAVPESIYNQFKVDGKIYSIPMYAPTYSFSGLIRQDWLDKLGLKMPTNYEELKNVAIAFTKNDPDGNGKDDTYGFALSENFGQGYDMGAYWSSGWYHKNKDGQYIPGIIGPGEKEIIQTLADAYAQGAVTKDFAVLNWAQGNKEFYSGKAGIFIGTPVGMVEDYYLGLLKVNPNAKLASIPFFVSPDGRQGSLKAPGYFGLTTLSSKLKSDPDKVTRILDMLDYGRQFIPMSERNPQNERFDWLMGKEGVGYDMKDGKVVMKQGSEAVTPVQYLMQRHEFWKPWSPNNEANEYPKTYNSPEMQQMIQGIVDMEKTYNKQPYDDPSLGIYSETKAQKGAELDKFIYGELTKMVAGQRPVSDWDKMVQEWMDRGGAQVIKEVNDGINARK